MDDCIFCKIIRGNIPSFNVYEDEDFIGILDINPNTEGVTLVITKEHHESYIFNNESTLMRKMMETSKKVAKKLENTLKVERVALVIEGMGVNHLHIKLYPLHGLGKEFAEMEHGNKKVFFNKYPGYITTQLGEQADFEELKNTADKINSK
jgi:diadenosine tetraphosphate (Ap4A) HIT family hydrolase